MKQIQLLFILLVFISSYCTSKPEQTKTVIVYGSHTCHHCIDFKEKLDSLGITYTFKDVETNQQLVNEMLTAVQSIDYKGYVSYPVVMVDTDVFVSPDILQVTEALEENKGGR